MSTDCVACTSRTTCMACTSGTTEQRHADSLLGPPPGYVGCDEGVEFLPQSGVLLVLDQMENQDPVVLDRIMVAVADDEQRARSKASVTAALHYLGLAATDFTSADAATTPGERLCARMRTETEDGLTVRGALGGHGDRRIADVVFTAVDFRRRVSSTPGLALGPVVALLRPTRSNGGIASGGTAWSATRRARRTSATNITKRSTR